MGLIRKGGVWHFDFQLRKRRYQGSTYTGDKKAAGKFEAEFKKRLLAELDGAAEAAPAPGPVPGRMPTFGELAQHISDTRRLKRKDRTFYANLAYLTEVIGPDVPIDKIADTDVVRLVISERIKGLMLGAKRLGYSGPVEPLIPEDFMPTDEPRELTIEELSGVLEELADEWADAEPPREPLGVASLLHGFVSPIRAVRKQAMEMGIPLPLLPSLNKKKLGSYARHRVMTPDEEIALIESAPVQHMKVYNFALQSMLRRTTIAELRWHEVDMPRREINVRVKGGKIFHRHITDAMAALLESQRGRHPSYVFTMTSRGGEQIRFERSRLSRFFRADCDRAGIEKLRFHDLRRTGATRLYQASRDIREVQIALGHAEVETTWDYVVREPGDRDRAERLRADADAAALAMARAAKLGVDLSGASVRTVPLARALETVSDEDLAELLAGRPELAARISRALPADDEGVR